MTRKVNQVIPIPYLVVVINLILVLLIANLLPAHATTDGLYSRNDWKSISNNLELLKLVEKMIVEGFIIDVGGGLRKGPNWKEPALITEKKYSFE